MLDSDSIYSPIIKLHDATLSSEQRLWISVVMQAAVDAASTNPEIKLEVINWMASDNFEMVCDMAGMSIPQVRHDLNATLAASDPKKSFRLAMSFRFLVRSFIEDNLGEVDKHRDSDSDIL
jgi:hypothetical protein